MPRNKITPPSPESDAEGHVLPALNAQEEKFLERLMLGENQGDAYLHAYGAKGYSKSALHVRACRKAAEPHIQEHLRALRSIGFAKTLLSVQERISDELAFAQRAENAGNFGAAGGAYDRVNKLLGLYVERHADVTETDPLQTIKEIAEIDPKLATELAHRYGIVWQGVEEQESDTRH